MLPKCRSRGSMDHNMGGCYRTTLSPLDLGQGDGTQLGYKKHLGDSSITHRAHVRKKALF